MLRRWFKKNLPSKESINHNSSMAELNHAVDLSHVWAVNKKSVSRGVAIGLFFAFIPLPIQMIIAAIFSLLFRANLPIAVVMTWITNPFTFIPINYFIYWVGIKILGEPVTDINMAELKWEFDSVSHVFTSISQLGKAYFVGLPVVAVGSAMLGYVIILLVWNMSNVFCKYKSKNKPPIN